jgi:phytoene synthase
MSIGPREVNASYAFCRQISRQSKSSFAISYLLLPCEQRRAMEALYAFMRHTDDLGDSPLLPYERRVFLAAWRETLDRALSGDISRPTADPYSPERLLPALADTVRRFNIPRDCLHAVIDGQDMDLTIHRYQRYDDLVAYCEKVASAVGVACIHVWGFEGGAEALELARQCGIAFQLTNIVRDVKEDFDNGRVYLPQEDLRRCEYTEDDLRAGVADERFLRLMRMEIERAEELYQRSSALAGRLAPAGRRAFGLMCDVYRRLLKRIASRPEEVLRRRIRLGRWTKLCIATRWIIGGRRQEESTL